MFFLSSQIDLDDPFIALDFVQRSLAKNAPLVKHSHLTGELPDKDHVMLDNDHGVARFDQSVALHH